MRRREGLLSLIPFILIILTAGRAGSQAIIAGHNAVAQFDIIPPAVIEQVKADYKIFYGHSSHGSQIVTGMEMLKSEDLLYDFNNGTGTLTLEELVGYDLGTGSEASSAWVSYTRNHLDQPDCETNVVMWAWCDGVSVSNSEKITNYLNNMTQLENDYPGVTFIYMTGHLDGTGPGGTLYTLNNQIRDYCQTNGKVLFDFADIESYNPDGTYYPYDTDACNWCYDWCDVHTCEMCPHDCAHSHCFNCYLKGEAFWWMMASIGGWVPETEVCGDANSDGSVDILDVVFLINYKYKDGPSPSPPYLSDVNSDGEINILDTVYIINYKYKSGPAPDCIE